MQSIEELGTINGIDGREATSRKQAILENGRYSRMLC